MYTRSKTAPQLESTLAAPIPPLRTRKAHNSTSFSEKHALPSHLHKRAQEIQTPITAIDEYIKSERLKSNGQQTLISDHGTQEDICPICHLGVLAEQDGLCCEQCNVWHHPTCEEINTKEYKHLQDETFDIAFVCGNCERQRLTTSTLPPPDAVNASINNAKWGVLQGLQIRQAVDSIYKRVVLWKKNMFKVPKGKIGERFIEEVANTINFFNSGSNLESVAISMTLIIFPLLLQKPSKSSKAKDHVTHLERRLQLWKDGEIEKLARECKSIQDRLLKSKYSPGHHNQVFTRLMLLGKVSAALRWNGSQRSKLLDTSPTVIQELKKKHPESSPSLESSLMKGPIEEVDAVIFDSIDSSRIEKVARDLSGSGGPSGTDAETWQHILCSKQFKKKPELLKEAVAVLARKLCCQKIQPDHLKTYIAGRLIPLDKDPGVRPIGIGEVLRRIVGKAVMTTLKQDIIMNTAPMQLCGGLQGGVEAAIHAVRKIFEEEATEAILLVDAENAFNALNRNTALRNLRYTCPELFTYILNTYRQEADLFIANSDDLIQSQEGTTQGDTSALGWYALSLMPLLREVQVKQTEPDTELESDREPNTYPKQVWYADDSAAGGKLDQLMKWWKDLKDHGPMYGYYPKPSKTWLIVKPEHATKAKELFPDVQITTKGHRYLGSYIGTEEGVKEFILKETESWKADILGLVDIAANEPQLAYSAFIYGTSKRWNFVCRTTPGISDHLKLLEYCVKEDFIPAIMGKGFVPDQIRKIASLPARMGGLSIPDCTSTAEMEYSNSVNATKQLTEAVFQQYTTFQLNEELQHDIISEVKKRKEEHYKHQRETIMNEVPPSTQRQLELLSEKGASIWLSTLPLKACGYVLNKQEFFDALSLRYNLTLSTANRSPLCVCGKQNHINHTLTCKIGGYVSLRHNSLRDTIAELLTTVCKDVETEPQLLSVPHTLDLSNGTNRQDGARLDISARSFWSPLDRAFTDVRVLHPQAQSNSDKSISQMYQSHEKNKKREYNDRVLNVEKATFTPLVFSTTGGMALEASQFLKHLAEKISLKGAGGGLHGNFLKIDFLVVSDRGE